MTTKSILVVDDEEGGRASLAANLELEGYAVVEAKDGAEAITLFRGAEFDLVITDVRMPKMNGVEAFREMKRLRPGVVVVMVTAFAAEGLLDEAMSEGAYTVLKKPFAMPQLFRIVEAAVNRPVVLVVDHDGEALATALGELGLRAELALDGPTAVRRVAEGRVDVCVLDLTVNGGDPLQTHVELRRMDPRMIVIAVSGDPVPELVHRFVSEGGYACLRKPYRLGELVRVIARARGDLAANEQ